MLEERIERIGRRIFQVTWLEAHLSSVLHATVDLLDGAVEILIEDSEPDKWMSQMVCISSTDSTSCTINRYQHTKIMVKMFGSNH